METLKTILDTILILIFVVIIFNIIIVVHELGHYWAALWRKLVVEKFQIWFGKAVIKKKINGVQWGLGTIPAGGFVALPQMAPMEMVEGKHENEEKLPPVKPIDKIITAFAGPLFSFLLAIFFASIVWFIGKPTSKNNLTTSIGYVVPGMPAEKAGIKVGDKILAINGEKVNRWAGMGNDIMTKVFLSSGEKINLTIERQDPTAEGGKITKTIPVGYHIEKSKTYERPKLRTIGIAPKGQFMIGDFAETLIPLKENPAKKAGLKLYDIIVAIDGKKINFSGDVSQIIKNSEGKALSFEVRRPHENQTRNVIVQPIHLKKEIKGQKIDGWYVGIIHDRNGETSIEYPNPAKQVYGSIKLVYDMVKALTSKKSDISISHLSGPVGIMNFYYYLFKDKYSWHKVLWFSVVLNVNLAIMNLLPLPILDGGHIMLALIEMIRGKPMRQRTMELLQTACFLLLIGFILYVTFYDLQDLGFVRAIINKF